MAQMNISNTLFNDTQSGVIAYVEQLKDRLLKNYIATLSQKDQGRIPADIKSELGVLQERLNEFFIKHWVDFQSFLLDEGVDPETIDSWHEVQEFLKGLPDDEAMWLKNKLTQLDNRITAMDIPDGGAYDVSADHVDGGGNYAVYVDLSAALDAVPSEKQKPGMSIRFIKGNSVQSSDNKYVQYMYNCTATTGTPNPFLDVANWEKINLEKDVNKLNNDIEDINETLTKNLSKDISEDYVGTLANCIVNRDGNVLSSNSWTLYIYKFNEDKELYVKRTNQAICGAIFNSSPALSDQGTVVFNNSTEESEFIFTLPANKYFAAARLDANYTYSIRTDAIDVKELSDSVNDLQSDVSSLKDDILEILGPSFSGNVTAGTALTYGTYYAPLERKSGDSITIEITEGLELFGTGTIFVYVKKKSNNTWIAPYALTNGKKTFTLTYDITAFSIATAANNVIGTGKFKVEYVGDFSISALQADVSNIEQGFVNGITNYNNIPFNQTSIADFLVKYKKQDVDAFNQLNVALAGDSIFGRMYGTELPYTPDMNDAEETSLGYQTGHFPPNMWCQNVPYAVLQYLQYKHSDVKYYNNIASEVVKTGTWSDNHNNADGVYLCYTGTLGDTIKLSFSDATHLKFIWSDYLTPASRGAQIKVSFSDDNGATWKSPSDLSLVEKIASDDNNGNGIYSLDYTEMFKFGNNIWKGFNKNTSYICKVELLNSHRLNVWGFETWSNPRVNVIVTAEGGNVANSQLNNPSRFYSWIYGQDLVIYELPFLNDLGVGVITTTYYKGKITLNSAAPVSPSEDQFYYCSEEGVYTNFGGLYAYKGDYISYKNSSWVIGSSFLDGIIDNYLDKNNKVFAFLSKMGVPLLTFTTHGSNNAETLRPYTNKVGLPLLRGLVKEYGFANIDVYAYHKFVLGGTDIWSDGTHLDSNGVAMYLTLIKSVVTLENNLLASASAKVGWKSLVGESSSDSVDFGFEFKEIPNVEVYNSTSRVVTAITSKGFTTTGSGSYKYRVSID